jgi:hypothetical protein
MEETNLSVPARLSGIGVGDVVRFRSEEVLNTVRVRLGWDYGMNYLCGQTRVITPEIMERIENGDCQIWSERNHWSISLDMIEFDNPEKERKGNLLPDDSGKTCIDFSIAITEKKQSIIDEMIGKVDKLRFKKLLAAGMDNEEKSLKDVSSEVVKKYLEEWANAKYEYYILFGNTFVIETNIEVEIGDKELKDKITELSYAFPEFCATISRFDMYEWKNNVLSGDDLFQKYTTTYKKGMKMSKFLSELLKSKSFDDAIAGVLSNRKINARLAISIDPYDYLTMSLNNYGWESCHKLGEGCYSTGTLSCMIDDSSLIAYKYNGSNSAYDYKNYKFEGNSKSWRQCVYFDKNTCSMIFSRQYPTTIDDVAKSIRELLESTVSAYLKKDNYWVIKSDCHDGYDANSSCLYHDVENDKPHKMVVHKQLNSNLETKFVVGEDIYCVECGGIIDDNEDDFLCSDRS